MIKAAEIDSLNQHFEHAPTEEVLGWAWERFGAGAAIGTSFQGAGLVMIHLSRCLGFKFPVFTLNTGLLFPETVETRQRLETFFGIEIEELQPDLTVEQQNAALGPELWKRDPDLCCTTRKVLPLQNKLRQLSCWMTGLRRQQSETRAGVQILELYTLEQGGASDLVKLNPMAAWTSDAVWQYIRKHRIPYNPLHDRGYRSIGCMPCTQIAAAGSGERAGRWTGFNKTECGIHTFLAKRS